MSLLNNTLSAKNQRWVLDENPNHFSADRNQLDNNDLSMKTKFPLASGSTSLIMVPCMNCDELILTKDVDMHSQKCTTVSKIVIAVRKSPHEFDEIDFKITRLKDSIYRMMDQVRRLDKDVKMNMKYLCRASEIAEAVVIVQSVGLMDERQLKDFKQELNNICGEYQGYSGILLHFRRLQSLVKQKLIVLIEQQKYPRQSFRNDSQKKYIVPSNNEEKLKLQNNLSHNSQSRNSDGTTQTATKDHIRSLITDKQQEIFHMKSMAQIYQQQTRNSQERSNDVLSINNYSSSQNQFRSPGTYNRDFSSIQSNINPRNTLLTNFSSMRDSYKSDIFSHVGSSVQYSEIQLNDDYQIIQNDKPSGDQLQRLFYSMCLNMKLKLPKNHPSQKLPVSLLYKEAQCKYVDQANWEEFISTALQFPFEYLDKNKIENYKNQKFVKNTLREMTQDSQFKNRLNQL